MFVAMTDKFLSGWGGASGKIAKYVIICETVEQVDQIVKVAESRDEMKYITTGNGEPYFRPGRYQVTVKRFSELGKLWKGNLA